MLRAALGSLDKGVRNARSWTPLCLTGTCWMTRTLVRNWRSSSLNGVPGFSWLITLSCRPPILVLTQEWIASNSALTNVSYRASNDLSKKQKKNSLRARNSAASNKSRATGISRSLGARRSLQRLNWRRWAGTNLLRGEANSKRDALGSNGGQRKDETARARSRRLIDWKRRYRLRRGHVANGIDCLLEIVGL